MIIHNPILTGSFTVNGTDVASITSSAASITAINAYTASQNILNGTYATTGSNTFKNPQTINSNLIVTGSITAATLVVQTITSSVVYSSGSNVFGNNIANTQTFTGSMNLTGSLTVVTTGIEFQVTNTGVRIGNISTDTHPITGSVNVSGSAAFSGSVTATSTIAQSSGEDGAAGPVMRLTSTNVNAGARNWAIINTWDNFGDLTFRVSSAKDGNAVSAGATRMVILSNGNIGIGTSSPSSLLHLQSSAAGGQNLRIQTSIAAGRNYMQFANGSGDMGWLGFGGADSKFYISNQLNDAMIFLTNDTERMRITSGGDVLIGATSSASAYSKVTIRGTNQGLAIQDAATNNYRAMYSQSGALYFYNGTNEGYLSSAGTWVDASDATLKKDIKDIEYGLSKVLELKPKWYRMIEDNLEQIGFIAQDVEEILPELVSTSERGMKGLSYGQLTAVLVKAIQELQAQITELKNK